MKDKTSSNSEKPKQRFKWFKNFTDSLCTEVLLCIRKLQNLLCWIIIFAIFSALTIALIYVIFLGIKLLWPVSKDLLYLIKTEEPKNVYETAINTATFTSIYITILFSLVGIVVSILGWRALLVLKGIQTLKRFEEETAKKFNVEGQLTIAKIFYSQKDYSEAWESIKDLPEDVGFEVLLYKAKILLQKKISLKEKEKRMAGKIKEEIKDHIGFQRIIGLLHQALEFPNISHENKAIIYQVLSRTWYTMGNNEKAMDFIIKSIKENYTYMSAHNDKAIILRHQEKLNEAIQYLEEVIVISPSYSYAHYNLSCYYCVQLNEDPSKYKDKVLTHLEKAIDFRPEFKEDAREDPDFDNIKDDEDFKNMLK